MTGRDCVCPYCSADLKIEIENVEEDEICDFNCPNCNKNFVYSIFIHIDIHPKKAPCLNGGKHKFHETKTYPQKFTRLECGVCGFNQPLSSERLAEIESAINDF